MSARVFNPLAMRRIHGPGGDAQPPTPTRRALFGPVDHDEVKRFLEQELADQSRQDASNWDFDFQTENPRAGGRFQWEPVTTEAADVPQAYELRRLPYLRDHATSEVSPKKIAESVPVPENTPVAEKSDAESAATSGSTADSNKQSRITDYLQTRKRTKAKKPSDSEPVMKQARIQKS